MKQIPLSQGKYALVDNEYYDFLMQWKWCYLNGYALRSEYIGKVNGKYKNKRVFMHRLINKTPDELFTDHINADKLDNRKENLRDCTISQNNMNNGIGITNTSGFKGVSLNKQNNKWQAFISINGKNKNLGCFKTPEEASYAYKVFAKQHHGEFYHE